MNTHLLEKISISILTVMILIVMIQAKSFSQNVKNPKEKDQKNPQTLTADQTAKIKAILSGYKASTLTAEDARAIHQKFREAGIHAGPETKDAIIAAGFDPEKLRSLAPPPSNERNNGHNPPTIEERLKTVDEKIIKPLSLTSTQAQSINTAFKNFFTEIDNIMKKQTNPQERPDKSVVEPVAKKRDSIIKQVLSEEQFIKYQELEKASRPPQTKEKESPKD